MVGGGPKPELQGFVRVLGPDVKTRRRWMVINLRQKQLEQYDGSRKNVILEVPFNIIVKTSMHKTKRKQFRVLYRADMQGFGEELEMTSPEAETWVREINKAVNEGVEITSLALSPRGGPTNEQQTVTITLPPSTSMASMSLSPRVGYSDGQATQDVKVNFGRDEEGAPPPPLPPRDDE